MKDAKLALRNWRRGRRRRARPDRRRDRRITRQSDCMVHDTPLIAVIISGPRDEAALTARRLPLLLFLGRRHTQIVAVVGVGKYVRLGTTVDDAMGEAFDKVAKMLSLPYPGGPEVERSAADGDPERFDFPRPMLGRPDANFSLSGLKTAVRNEASRMTPLEPQDVSDLCASFQAAVLESTADRLSVGSDFSETVRTPARWWRPAESRQHAIAAHCRKSPQKRRPRDHSAASDAR